MVFWGENSPSSLHKKWCEVTQNDSFLIVINLIYNIVIFQGQNRAENRKMLTPTQKLIRRNVAAAYKEQIEALFK